MRLTLFLQGFLLDPQEHWGVQWSPTALQGQFFLRWHVLAQKNVQPFPSKEVICL